MLHARRKRLEEMAEQEAAGVNLWTEAFDQAFRIKIHHAIADAGGPKWWEYARGARDLILRDEGLLTLGFNNQHTDEDFRGYVKGCSDEMVPTAIEAFVAAMASPTVRAKAGHGGSLSEFEASVKLALQEHRIAYDLVEGRMVEFSSRELHVNVTVPALTLLAGRKDLAKAESAYQDALEEITRGKAANAITDAGTALQETLTALGCAGSSLGPLIKSAKSNGLFAKHDGPMLDSVEKVAHWISADRSELGDAHETTDAVVADAWFIVHVVGALILRLADDQRRGA